LEPGNTNRFYLPLICSLDVSIYLDKDYSNFDTPACNQSSEQKIFLLPEKEDGEQIPEGNELVSVV
jgi:hypothetical protein